LCSAGLDEFVAAGAAEYEELAVRLAASPGTPQRLAQLRATMRERLQSSRLCDWAGFASDMERLYREMWADWCGRNLAEA
jgi:predicted O-linked N-acetylglucosamine transferase (SPINDLY family)